MAEIILKNGEAVLVDDEDFDLVSKYRWRKLNTGYACTKINKKTVYMHRLILNLSDPKIHTDHINHNGLDNRKDNLWIATTSQNAANQLKYKKETSSKYKGVSWNKEKKKWTAKIMVNYKKKHLGYYLNEIEAARKYDEVAKQSFGEFALVNFK